ncbi:hypothetical protein ACFU5B_12330 [Streptomyces murinus]|uniref:hypothetical protein n=1 Tax=Streptomyces murinus TaxID=33900 RepID=UPI0036366C37
MADKKPKLSLVIVLGAVSHLSKREQVIDSLSSAADLDVMQFLKKFLSKNPPTSLDAVLKSKTGALAVDIMDRIAATSLVAEAMSNPSVRTPANALRIVRNNLAHGTRGYDAENLGVPRQRSETSLRRI